MSAPDTLTTRFPSGFTNAGPNQTMSGSGIPDPSWANVYHNDFNTFAAADLTQTLVGTGGIALLAADGGAVRVSTTAGATDATYEQLPTATFKLVAGTDTYFKFAATLSEVVNCVVHAGLIIPSATPQAAADGVWLVKPTGAATWQLKTVIGGVATTSNLPTGLVAVAATQFELGFHVDYLGNVEVFFNPTTGASFPPDPNKNPKGRVYLQTGIALTQQLLAPSFGITNTTAVARTLDVDYVTAVRDR